MKKKIPVRYYEKVLPDTVTPSEGELVNEGGTLYIVTTI